MSDVQEKSAHSGENAPRAGSPLRRRFIASIGLMLLPFLVLSVAGYVLFRDVMGSFQEIKTEAFEELSPVLRIQILMQKAAMPPNDYLITGDRKEQRSFHQLVAEVDKSFENAFHLPFKRAQEKNLIRALHADWLNIKDAGNRLFTYPVRQGNRMAAEAMERFDAHVDATDRLFAELVAVIDRELNEEQAAVQAANKRMAWLVAAIFLTGGALNIGIGVALARSVLVPARELERGAEHFTAGNLAHRVPVSADNELGRLATAFNTMAERIDRHAKELKELSIHDGLTGLFNKREFGVRLADEIARAQRYRGAFSLIMIDIDHFKAVNDTYGHQAGDEVLTSVSAVIKGEARDVDFVARYGGEEIVVVLPHVKGADALTVAERVRTAVAARSVPMRGGKTVNVTVSLGVAAYPDDADTGEKLVGAADEALYRAKRSGRNRTERSGGGHTA